MKRRSFLGMLALGALVAACGSDEDGSSSSDSSTTNSTSASGSAASGAAAVQPKGELKLAFGIHMPGTLDATKDGFGLIFVGAGETLARINIQQKPEPWLAEAITQIDATTWKATLRPNATFHDGSAVTAQDVVASFRRSWETQAAAKSFIPDDTTVTAVDGRTVEFKLSRPVGAFLNGLAAFQFVVAKPGGPSGGSWMTGSYKPVRLETDNLLILDAHTGHWAGPPPIAKLNIKLVTDANARALALQSGDVDMVFNLPAEQVRGLGSDVEKAVVASTRMHMMLLNQSRPIFSDVKVREATSLALDRDTINKVAIDGLGSVAVGLFPPNTAVEVVPSQSTDVNRAKQLLDEAGWRAGPDGVRVKDGRRLSFTILSYPGRAELTPMGVVVQSQLKAIGYETQLQQVQNITAELSKGEWDASMYSIGTLPTGDPLYLFVNTLSKVGSSNPSGYSNPTIDRVIAGLLTETDPAKRAALAKEGQEAVKADVPNIYLAGAPLGYFWKKGKISNFTPNPNDLYFITRDMKMN